MVAMTTLHHGYNMRLAYQSMEHWRVDAGKAVYTEHGWPEWCCLVLNADVGVKKVKMPHKPHGDLCIKEDLDQLRV